MQRNLQTSILGNRLMLSYFTDQEIAGRKVQGSPSGGLADGAASLIYRNCEALFVAIAFNRIEWKR